MTDALHEDLRIAIVGRGRVGSAIVRALPGAAGPFGRGFDGDAFDVVLLAVPDREIAAAASAVVGRPGRLVGHCSGATPIDAIGGHERFGLHPLMTIADGAAPEVFAGAPAAIAGSTERAREVARALADRLGMRAFAIDDRDRATYHAAAAFASNFLVTVEDAAEVLLGSIGLDRSILAPIVRTSVENWVGAGRDSLTGPVRRGDDATVERHRAAVSEHAPELLALFDALVARTRAISIADHRGTGAGGAIEAIDAANADDPNRVEGEPMALLQGRLAHDWVLRLDPGASDALVLAARAHHLRRWAVPRSTYPEGRPGYLRWRRDQKARHAAELRQLLERAGVDPATVDRATTIVAKVGLGTDPEVQTFEDAVCLTFLRTQLAATVEKVGDDEHMVDVIAKTLGKMSDAGRAAALTVEVDARHAGLVARAVERFTSG